MALGSTQSLAEMGTRNISGGKGRPARKADSFTAICEPTVSQPYGPPRTVTGIALALLLWLSKEIAIIFLNIIVRLVFVKEIQCVFCEVAIYFIKILNRLIRGLKDSTFYKLKVFFIPHSWSPQ
jgi:hypothetical protein